MHDFKAVTCALSIAHEQLDIALEKLSTGDVSARSFGKIAELAAISADLSSQLAALAANIGGLNVHNTPKGMN